MPLLSADPRVTRSGCPGTGRSRIAPRDHLVTRPQSSAVSRVDDIPDRALGRALAARRCGRSPNRGVDRHQPTLPPGAAKTGPHWPRPGRRCGQVAATRGGQLCNRATTGSAESCGRSVISRLQVTSSVRTRGQAASANSAKSCRSRNPGPLPARHDASAVSHELGERRISSRIVPATGVAPLRPVHVIVGSRPTVTRMCSNPIRISSPCLAAYAVGVQFTADTRRSGRRRGGGCWGRCHPARPRVGRRRYFPAPELFKGVGTAGLLGLEYDPAYGGQGRTIPTKWYSARTRRRAARGSRGDCGAERPGHPPRAQPRAATSEARTGPAAARRDGPPPYAYRADAGSGRGRNPYPRGTRRRRLGVNGSKLYITTAPRRDWLCLLARTSAEGGYLGSVADRDSDGRPGFSVAASCASSANSHRTPRAVLHRMHG